MAPTSAVTALLYYFGWARTSVQAQQMGLDDSLLGYSTQDYLLRSLTSMTIPLVVALVATVVGLLLHTVVVRWLAEGSKPDGPGMADRRAQVLLRGLVGGIAAWVWSCCWWAWWARSRSGPRRSSSWPRPCA